MVAGWLARMVKRLQLATAGQSRTALHGQRNLAAHLACAPNWANGSQCLHTHTTMVVWVHMWQKGACKLALPRGGHSGQQWWSGVAPPGQASWATRPPHVGNKADVGTEIGFNVSGLATFP